MLRAYDEVRRGISYLRWHEEDVEKIAPSLWAGRGTRTDRQKPVEPASPNVTLAPNPAPAPVQTAPNTSATAPAAKPGVGMPGSDNPDPSLRSQVAVLERLGLERRFGSTQGYVSTTELLSLLRDRGLEPKNSTCRRMSVIVPFAIGKFW